MSTSVGEATGNSKYRGTLLLYFYVVVLVALIALAVGCSILLNLIASYIFNANFAYNVQNSCCGLSLNAQRQSDLFSSIPLIVVGAAFLALHVFGIKQVITEEEQRTHKVPRLFTFLGAAGFGIAAIITTVSGLQTLLQYWITPHSDNGPFEPGPSLAAAIVTLIIWQFFFRGALRQLQRKKDFTPSPPPTDSPTS